MPVIFVTGTAFIDAVTKGLREGTFYYFEKPVDLNLLKCTLKDILGMKDFELKINRLRDWLRENIHHN